MESSGKPLIQRFSMVFWPVIGLLAALAGGSARAQTPLPFARGDAVGLNLNFRLEILGIGEADLDLTGSLVWMRSAPQAPEASNCRIAIEVVGLRAVGEASPFGAIRVTHDPARSAAGELQSAGTPCVFPVSGFVDLALRIEVENFPVDLVTETEVRVTVPSLAALPPLFESWIATGPMALRNADDPSVPSFASISDALRLSFPHTLTAVAGDDALLQGVGSDPPPAIPAVRLSLLDEDVIDALSFGLETIDDPSVTRIAFSKAMAQAEEPVFISAFTDGHERLIEPAELGLTGSGVAALDLSSPTGVDSDSNTLPERPVFFSLAPGSPTLAGMGAVAADILVFDPTLGLGIFAFADTDLGLTLNDDIDALCLMKAGLPIPFLRHGVSDVAAQFDGVRNSQHDWALYSLAPGSPSLALFQASPSDIFITNFSRRVGSNAGSTVYVDRSALGLGAQDDIDAMSCVRALAAVAISGTASASGTLLANAGLPEDAGDPLAPRDVPGTYDFWKVDNPIDGHRDGPFALPEAATPGALHVGDPVTLPWDSQGACGGFQLDDTKFEHAEPEPVCGHGRFVSLVGPQLEIGDGDAPEEVARALAESIASDPTLQGLGVDAHWHRRTPLGNAALIVTGAGPTRFEILESEGHGMAFGSPVDVFALPLVGPADADQDGVLDSEDNCPAHANTNQADEDDDGVGDVCDNCVDRFNPRLGDLGTPDREAFQSSTGGQLDDDGDGFGNACDAKFLAGGLVVGGPDLVAQQSSFNRDRSGQDCGLQRNLPCAIFDLDNAGQFIGAADLGRALTLFNRAPGPRCGACPLECEGPAC